MEVQFTDDNCRAAYNGLLHLVERIKGDPYHHAKWNDVVECGLCRECKSVAPLLFRDVTYS